ncbi:uncharacterized protein LOC131207951 [Anopheles bellator]|uniref:uncharacterized protein LOC131207951 n=1 Tax=Anopheles bellator TaxID=139047 RepID=UPI0026498836|nr:uncharacterized protein LOC131207951 [Anopheles bellator]
MAVSAPCCQRGWFLLVLVALLTLLAGHHQQEEAAGGAMASIIYAGYALPMPRHRTFYNAVGERKIGPNLWEVTTIVQADILLRKQCECMLRHRCRVPRNIFYLSNHDCHHREKVCCELLENAYESDSEKPAGTATDGGGTFASDNEI